MAEAVERSGLTFTTGYFFRTLPVNLFLKDEIAKGNLGTITRVRSSYSQDTSLTGWLKGTPYLWAADVKLAGDWAQASDMESWSTSPGFAAFLGAGYKFNEAKHGDAGIDATVNNLLTGVPMFNLGQTSEFTVDSLIKCHGLGLMGSFYGLYLNDISTPTPGLTSAQWYGATAQAGYLIADRVEPFVRYEWLFPDQGLTHGSNQINIVTTGATYYIRKHAAKFTLDCMWCLDNINPSSTLDTILVGTGLTFDAPNRTGQVVLRAQFQFMF